MNLTTPPPPAAERSRVLAEAFESGQECLALLSLAGKFLYANRATLDALGFVSEEECLAREWETLLASPAVSYWSERILPALEQHGEWQGEIALRRADGAVAEFELRLSALGPDRVLQFVRPLRSARVQPAVIPREFLSKISHEFRTPLATMQGVAYLLQKDAAAAPGGLADRHVRWHHLLRDAMVRLRELADQVLEWNRVESAARSPRQPIPVAPLLEHVAAAANDKASLTRVTCTVTAGVPEKIPLNEALLRTVLEHYVANAVKFSSPDTPVLLLATRLGAKVRFSVVDRGRGIPLAEQARLWEPFFRASNATDEPGTGLGLMIAKRAAELLDARVGAVSQAGHGSTFWIDLLA
jgi:PAS domain S-box-containing protein